MAAAVALVVFPLLSGPVDAAVFSNPAPIRVPRPGAPPGCPTFPAPNNSCPPTSAVPYPSTISVAGQVGTVTDVNVTLNDLTYTIWDGSDLDVMLVAPDGSRVMLMSDACGESIDSTELPITTPIDLTFDDAAATGLPQDTACTSGTFRPTDDDNDPNFDFTGDDVFCGPPTTPGSCPPAGAPPTATTTLLSTFNGINPNGTWSLYVVDDTPGDPDPTPADPNNADSFGGQFAGGWTLEVLTAGAPTTVSPTTAPPTTVSPTTAPPTTVSPTTAPPTTVSPTTAPPTTVSPTTLPPTTVSPTTLPPTTVSPTTLPPTTVSPTTLPPTTVSPTTVSPTTVSPTTVSPTTVSPTTVPPTTVSPTTVSPTTVPPTTLLPTTTSTTDPPTTSTTDPPTSTVTTTGTGGGSTPPAVRGGALARTGAGLGGAARIALALLTLGLAIRVTAGRSRRAGGP